MSVSTQSDLVSALLAADPDSAEVRRTNLGVVRTQIIPDANNLNYSGGSVTFNSNCLIGATSKRLVDFANAIVRVSTVTFGSGSPVSLAPGDVQLVGINPLLAINQIEMRVGNQLVHAAQEGLPLMLANRARTMNPEQRRFMCDVKGWDIDDYVSQVYSATAGIVFPCEIIHVGKDLLIGDLKIEWVSLMARAH